MKLSDWAKKMGISYRRAIYNIYVQTLKTWYKNKISVYRETNKTIKDIQNLRTFYYLMKAEYGEYAMKDWNTLFRKFLRDQGLL